MSQHPILPNPPSPHRPPWPLVRARRRYRSRRRRECWASIRTRSLHGATRDASATTGSTIAATSATGRPTCSGSSPRQPPGRPRRSRAAAQRHARRGAAVPPCSPTSPPAWTCSPTSRRSPRSRPGLTPPSTWPANGSARRRGPPGRHLGTPAGRAGARAIDAEGAGVTAARTVAPGRGLFSLAIDSPVPIHGARARRSGPGPGPGHRRAGRPDPRRRCSLGPPGPGGRHAAGPPRRTRLAGAIARTLGVLIRSATATQPASVRLAGPRRCDALPGPCVAARLGDVVRDLGDHARALFGSDRVAVVLRDPEGRVSSPGGVGFSARFLELARGLEEGRPHGGHAAAAARDPPGAGAGRRGSSAVRAAAVQDGVETLWSRRWWMDTPTLARSTWATTWRTAGARLGPRRRRGPGRRCVHRCVFRAHLRCKGVPGRPSSS